MKRFAKHLRHLVPDVVSYSRFFGLEKEVAVPLALLSRRYFWENAQV
ncbi:hypothetical protein HMPREF0973_02744 [Prevotella veroralis F0319]|uniref:Uncharacterized protein n=1 Tax=Prevotella veroralis F0319 TaxID=649761 RepID=C9MSX5_9BACT|nr:hypothetical protein HMPREF0973_02744 [Prevotella veroralis F0319]